MKTFLLLFQEEVAPQNSPDGSGQPMTTSAVADQHLSKIVAGTKTITEVRQETIDSDPRTASFLALPK